MLAAVELGTSGEATASLAGDAPGTKEAGPVEPESNPRPRGRRRAISSSRLLQRPWLVAVVLALLFGLALALITPPFMGGDERDHFTRAFQISEGSVLTTKHDGLYGAYLPRSLAQQEQVLSVDAYIRHDRTAFLGQLGAPTPQGPTTFVSITNAASYGPGAYVAYAPAIALGRLLGLSTLGLLYLARIAGLVIYALLLGLAVRRLSVHRWVLVAAGLIPAALNQASTVSADGITTVLTLLIVAEAVHLTMEREIHLRRVLIECALAIAVLALAKPPYILFAGLLLVPAWRRRGALAGWVVGILAGGAVLTLVWGWYQKSHSLSQNLKGIWYITPKNQYAFHGIDISKQTHLIATQPWVLVSATFRSLWFQGFTNLKQLLGMLALYQESWVLVLLAGFTLAFSCVVNEEGTASRLDRTLRLWLLVLVVVVFFAIFAIAYTNWNMFHAPRVDAVPPRYFLALIPCLLIGVLPARLRLRALERYVDPRVVLTGLLVTVLTCSVVGAWSFHYLNFVPLK